MRPAELAALGLDAGLARQRSAWLSANPGFVARCIGLFLKDRDFGPCDADADLYGGFPGNADKRLFSRIRSAAPDTLPHFSGQLQDPRLKTLLFRYQARNWPESLDATQQAEWSAFRRARFGENNAHLESTAMAFATELAKARGMASEDSQQALLQIVEDWSRERLTEVGLTLPS